MALRATSEELSKVPAVTLGFWAIKILATTLGEIAGDTVSMNFELGYLAATVVFVGGLAVLVAAEIAAKKFIPVLYWATILASTTAGTTLADFFDRSLGIGYAGGAAALAACVLASLALWYRSEGSIAVQKVNTPRREAFYWLTITFSQTLGTALGDWTADGLGFLGGAALFGGVLTVLAALYFTTALSRVVLFWSAFVLTRPLGATLGDFFDKAPSEGGLGVSRPLATALIFGATVLAIALIPQRADKEAA
ncbi:putative membrane-anchored protein [Rhizomicrobium palustre]|uniref:Putative membrane-anchored protein n=1 Tax=Rhizomicrobium palustre TaxID=189966 RepID=A0A846MZ84_9PROT|nr:hypothetical protein [Rhizomicrobium palustre]NIK88756.1 putative membrane-anchored protein [Rhizomicrobium palustre]